MQDTKFMMAQEKVRVLKQWESFLKSGLTREKFTKPLYGHLINHCSFIAHYNIDGFYSTYFENGDNTVQFLKQFDNRNGIPESIEYGITYWYTNPEYNDINSAMCHVASKYIPDLISKALFKQRANDIEYARRLLAKHGLPLDVK